ncbi:hypothetical protein NEOC65_002131, partial [Neochlamydia sp. AcF65]|uniref:hypothetical protein n=1 Tax=Neochlamydia sp. AcF65 TaxID=2795735 RepID=UPI001BC9398F
MKEHYGIETSSSMVRLITQKHASKIAKLKKEAVSQEAIIISETDGSMVPIVEIDQIDKQAKKDARKARKVCWKEAKLSLARGNDRANRFYAGSIGT